jgi:glycosyltransferase involved in cell wall biosynthesis
MRVTLVVPGFPTKENPRRGVFNLRAQQALSAFADVAVVFLRAWAPGRRRRQESEFAGAKTTIVTAFQLPIHMPGSRFNMAANVLLYRKLGWAAVRESIVNADMLHSVDAVVGMVVSHWAARTGKRHVTQVIGSDVNTIIPRLPSFAARGWERWLHAVICNSRSLEQRFTELYPSVPNVRTIPRGVDTDIFAPVGPTKGPVADAAPVRFAFFGGFQRQALSPHYVKGGPTLLSAWKDGESELAKAGASLLLAGPHCRSDMVNRWHRTLRYPSLVHVVGEIPPPDMPSFLRAIDVVLVPSFAEGLPNVCLEAAACGRSVLASAVGGIPDVVVDGATGLILPPGDIDAWRRALVGVSMQHTRLVDMGRNGRERIQQLFDSRSYGKSVLALYHEAMRLPITSGKS